LIIESVSVSSSPYLKVWLEKIGIAIFELTEEMGINL
jgi:hypothetical protein